MILLSADCFQYKLFQKNSLRNTIRVSNRLSVGPDLDPIHLQRLSADDKSQR